MKEDEFDQEREALLDRCPVVRSYITTGIKVDFRMSQLTSGETNIQIKDTPLEQIYQFAARNEIHALRRKIEKQFDTISGSHPELPKIADALVKVGEGIQVLSPEDNWVFPKSLLMKAFLVMGGELKNIDTDGDSVGVSIKRTIFDNHLTRSGLEMVQRRRTLPLAPHMYEQHRLFWTSVLEVGRIYGSGFPSFPPKFIIIK